MLRVCADIGTTLNVTACLIVAEDKKHPGRFRFHRTLRGDGAIEYYSSSVGSESYQTNLFSKTILECSLFHEIAVLDVAC